MSEINLVHCHCLGIVVMWLVAYEMFALLSDVFGLLACRFWRLERKVFFFAQYIINENCLATFSYYYK